MNTASFYRTIFRTSLIAAGFSAVLGMSIANAAPDETSAPQAHSDGVSATISDAAITTQVKSKLMGEKILKKSKISVTTTNGVVTLDGKASSSKAKAFAETSAKSVDGVKSVDNNLKTPGSSKTVAKTKQAVSDSWITTKVKSDILANSITKGFDVSITTIDGVVVLKGMLASQDEVNYVKDISGKVNGVKSVDTSALTIASK